MLIGDAEPTWRDVLDMAFNVPSFPDMYQTLSSMYQRLAFTDPLTDAQKFDEFSKITQQFKKFVGTSQRITQSMAEDPEAVAEYWKEHAPRTYEYPKTRADMVYSMLRDEWLSNLIAMAEQYAEEER